MPISGITQRLAPEPVASCSSSFSATPRASCSGRSLRGRRAGQAGSQLTAAVLPVSRSCHAAGLHASAHYPLAACAYRKAFTGVPQACNALHGTLHLGSRARCTRTICQGLGSNRKGMPFDEEDYPLEVPTKFELMQRPDKQKPLVRVRLSVHFRVHSRQMLCIGGSQIPMGWSFLSISRVPMTWNSGDLWTVEVDLQAGQRIEYKYVILEEQDWTKIEDQDSQGLVEISYRSGSQPGVPPDVQVIQKQMAIVAWQPGPNRVLQVPSERELLDLQVGQAIERIPARPNQRIPYDGLAQGKKSPQLKADPFEGTWEVLTTDENGQPILDRHDVWQWVGSSGAKPTNSLRGFNFGNF